MRGRITEGWNYTRHLGEPAPGIDVKVVHNPVDAMVTSRSSSPTTAIDGGGYFYFDNIPQSCYNVYVDIPGLRRDSLWHICIDAVNTDFQFLDYVASDSSVYIVPQLSIGIANNTNNATNFTVFPNPFVGTTTIEYNLLTDAEVRLDVFDVVGKKVQALVNAKQLPGNHTFTLNAPDNRLQAGVYLVTLSVNGNTKTQRVVVME